MKIIPYNFDWDFTEGFGRFAMGNPAIKVDLPHDYIIGKPRSKDSPGSTSTGFFPNGTGSYTKEFDMPAEWAGKTIILEVDGAYMNSEVFVNNDKLNHHPYGYTAYHVDITRKLRSDIKNTLRISTQSIQPSSRWYSGGGLYREVNLLLGGACYIHPWDTFITTPVVSGNNALVRVATQITNNAKECDAEIKVCIQNPGGETVASATNTISLCKNGKTAAAIELNVDHPLLWDTENPNLYTMHIAVNAHGDCDESSVSFGIRKIEIDTSGFRLNGKTMKLRGGCIHHDNTLLGACAYPRAEQRKIEILKASGYNAVRTAHNPPSKALLDACDKLGMLVLDESFDMWRMQKNPLDYHLYFEKWWQHDTSAMVLRDRNHPSIYCWSIGNEIPEMYDTSDGAYWAKQQADFIRTLDPTRPVSASANGFTAAIPGKPPTPRDSKAQMQNKPRMGLPTDQEDIWGDQTEATGKALDIFGYNYLYGRYAHDKKRFPNRVIHATETHSFYTYDYWQAMQQHDQVIGDFIWTAYDNLGEAGAGRVIYDLDEPVRGLMGTYPWLSCYQGDHDLDGNRRPQAYYRKVMWGLDQGIHVFTTHPSMTGKPFYGMGWHWEDVKQNWTFEPEYIGKPVKVQAYADCDEVEFILNGKSMAKVIPEELKAIAEIAYAPGVLEVVALKNGEKIATDTLKTAGKAAAIRLSADRSEIAADGLDLSFITVEVVDENGILIIENPANISVDVSGAGSLVGLGSGNPKTEENYGTGQRFTFNGRALVCLRAAKEAGDIQVVVRGEGLKTGCATIRSV